MSGNAARLYEEDFVRWTEEQSSVLREAARLGTKLPLDWETHSGSGPLMMEALVDSARFRGTCYRAANWIHLGQTTGRGRMDREHQTHGHAVKDIYVYPLVRDVRHRLCSDLTQ